MSEISNGPLESDAAEQSRSDIDEVTDLAVEAVAGSPDQAWKMLGLVNDWVKHAETKAAGTIAASGVSAGILYNLFKDVPAHAALARIPGVISGALLAIAGLSAAWALRPRLWSREEPVSSLYFDHIARRHRPKAGNRGFTETVRVLSVSDAELVGEIAGQIWANAHVARKKYRWANIGLCALLLALIALAVAALAVVGTGH